MNTTIERERVYITHKRRMPWNLCPLCGATIKWVRLWTGEWSPCDELPVLFTKDRESKKQIVSRRELVTGKLLNPKKPDTVRVFTGRLPHYYSCPQLLEMRRDYAIRARMEEYANGAGRA